MFQIKGLKEGLIFFITMPRLKYMHFDSNEDPSLKYRILFSVVQKPKFFLMKVCFSVWDGDYGGLVNKRRVFTHTHAHTGRERVFCLGGRPLNPLSMIITERNTHTHALRMCTNTDTHSPQNLRNSSTQFRYL